ncbi:40S ribosomal protein S18 [Astathelohania contejeani]|uniref:40S ribosomal protein S18 n=1 Tax=Astathelohania contejeani TaxID=164912 RepID=A0ABQ7HX91_9MICR|nr:40S ribosomal protein S18 [Thelohania contejeani]
MDVKNFTAEPEKINHIIRMLNTNVDGTRRLNIALTDIRGVGRRFADMVCKRAGIDGTRRAGELSEEELNIIQSIITDPASVNIPEWAFNHRRDIVDGLSTHLVGNQIDADFRLHLERGKKIKHVRVCRLAAGLKVRGQRTKSNGRRGRTVGVSRKK